MQDNLTSSNGAEFSIQNLVDSGLSGRIRVPEFQRSFRWTSGDVLALFDSILKGYPVGSVLLWQKTAPAHRVTLGALTFNSAEHHNALWVVDGQQRITSLVNAVLKESYDVDERFRVLYSVKRKKFVRPADARGTLAIPLPDLFDIAKLLQWFQHNPEALDDATHIQTVTARLRDFKVPASVVEQADEGVLRDIFDRMNTAGRRLRSAEIFDAIHRADGDTQAGDLSIPAIADRIAATTTFGRIEDAAVYQAILVRRHPDITRDPHGEFDSERKLETPFSREGRDEGYRRAEEALQLAVHFLSGVAGVPHISFLPYRFLILILVRFFALYPKPRPRNKELLAYWFWRAATRAPELSFNGSTANVRALAGNIVAGDEERSIKNLLSSVRMTGVPYRKAAITRDIRRFSTNRASGKIILCALWASGPKSIKTGKPIGAEEIAEILDQSETPADVAIELIPRRKLPPEYRRSAGNRAISAYPSSMNDVLASLNSLDDASTVAESNLLTPHLLAALADADGVEFVLQREDLVETALTRFVETMTGERFEDTPALDALDLDDIDDDDTQEIESEPDPDEDWDSPFDREA